MGDLTRCGNCGLVMGGEHPHCIGCGAAYDRPFSQDPPPSTAQGAAPTGSVPAEPAPDEPPPARPGLIQQAPGQPAPRPDPYSQISNPLHTDWDPRAPRVATTDDVSYTVQSRRVRSPWIRRVVIMVLLAALGAGTWLARDQISSAYDDLSDRISSDEALGAATQQF